MDQGRWVLGVLLMCAVACSGEAAPSPLTDPTTLPTTARSSVATTAIEPTVTTSVPRTTTTADPDALDLTHPDAPAPEVNLEAETWAELLLVWRDIEEYWRWLEAHPDQAGPLIAVIFHPEGPDFVEQVDGLQAVAERGWRVVSNDLIGEVTAFGCCQNPDAEMESGGISIEIRSRTDDNPHAQVLRTDGTVQEELPGWDFRQYTLVLRRTSDEEWKIWSFD